FYLKIAEFYWQNNQKEEASRAFIEGAVRLAENGNHEEAVTVFERVLEVVPEDLVAIRGYVSSQIKLGYPEEGVRVLDELYTHDPNNIDVVHSLVDCYLDMDTPDKAEIVIVELVANDPKAYAKLLDLVEYYLKHDDLGSAVRLLSMISEQLLVSQKPERLLDYLNEIVARNPEDIQALRLLVRYYTWHKNEGELRKVLEHLLDAANFAQSMEDERFAITQLLLLSPQDDKYITRLKKLNGVETVDDDEESDSVAPLREGVPTFESFNGLLNDAEGGDAAEDSAVEYTLESFSEETAEITLTEADLQPVEVDEINPTEKVFNIEEQIENLRFYVDQGYLEIAQQTIKELDEEHGALAEFNEIREIIGSLAPATDVDSGQEGRSEETYVIEASPDESLEEVEKELTEAAEGSSLSISEESEEASLTDENDEEIGANNPFEEQIEEKSDGQTESEEESGGEFDREALAEPETYELSDEPPSKDGAVEEVESGTDVSSTPKQETIEADQTESEPVATEAAAVAAETDEEFENHYHHAVAYKEMGLLEDSIREFQSAIECVDANDGSGRFLQCCTLIGHCLVEKNLPHDAIVWFDKAFEVNGLNDEEKQALNYELASAYAQDCNYQKALTIFEEIHGEEADYRDVAERLDECRESANLVPA
uniref:hypothetical protein n=1 Tax=uncultured Eudoraea sp. TaxID=1035614 RepID=UPI002627B789